MKPLTLLALTFSSLMAVGCGNRTPSSPGTTDFQVQVRATSDDDQAVEGVTVTAAGHHLGSTSSMGTLKARVSGDEGQTVAMAVTCPAGFISPERPRSLRLTRARALGTGRTEPLAHDVTCDRKSRDIVVAVKASGAPDTPVLINGHREATTDENGIAHVALTVDRNAPSVRIDLDTSADTSLVPQNPSRTYTLKARDSILVFEQALSRRARPRLQKAVRAPTRHIPQRLN